MRREIEITAMGESLRTFLDLDTGTRRTQDFDATFEPKDENALRYDHVREVFVSAFRQFDELDAQQQSNLLIELFGFGGVSLLAGLRVRQ